MNFDHKDESTIYSSKHEFFENSAAQYIGAKKAEPLLTPLFNVNLFVSVQRKVDRFLLLYPGSC
jgi:hypothetical protein